MKYFILITSTLLIVEALILGFRINIYLVILTLSMILISVVEKKYKIFLSSSILILPLFFGCSTINLAFSLESSLLILCF
uniref:Uncharacterized protein n=1 Tax=Acidianus brierleyi TaxID=41673 RepID=A0A2U9IH33_9CREN